MAAVLTSPLAFMVRTRAICNIEVGPVHPGPTFFARTSAELRFSQQIAKGNFLREQLGVGFFQWWRFWPAYAANLVKTRAIGKRFCPASLLAPFPFLFI